MSKYNITDQLPYKLQGPFGFRERGSTIEGYVESPKDLLKRFEPVDVLNGAIELIDQKGAIITIHCDDQSTIDDNEYPQGYEGVYYLVRERLARS